MEQENLKTNTDSSQITFKLTPEERRYIEKEVEKFDTTLSEYIRIKVLDNADQTFKLKSKLLAQLKENKRLQIMLSRFQEMELTPDCMILPVSQEIKKIFETLFSDNDSETTPEVKIIEFLMVVVMRKGIFQDLSWGKNITINQIDEALKSFKAELEDFNAENEEDFEEKD